MMKIAIASDHAGFDYKKKIIDFLSNSGYNTIDFGTNSLESMDYPDVVHPLAKEVGSGGCALGILLCGSGNGVAITANKHQDIRAALCWNTEIASLARKHNDANVLCLPARFISLDDALAIVKQFLTEKFEGGRHLNRVQKISCR